MKELTNEELEERLEKAWIDVVLRFKPAPRGVKQPRLEDNTRKNIFDREKRKIETAEIDIISHEVTVYRSFINNLLPYTKDLDVLLRGILMHEVCHYARFPADLAAHIVLLELAMSRFGGFGPAIYPHYADIIDNTSAVTNVGADDEIIELYRCMAMWTQDQIKKGEIKEIMAYPIFLSMLYYQYQFKEEIVKDVPKAVRERFEKRVEEEDKESIMQRIPFLTDLGYTYEHSGLFDKESVLHHELNLMAYAELIKDWLEEIAKQNGNCQNGTCQNMGRGMGGPGSRKPTPKELDDALEKLRQQKSKSTYERLRKFARQLYPDLFKDESKNKGQGSGIGPGGGVAQLVVEEDTVTHYLRLTAGMPLYIKPKPLEVSDKDSYPCTRVEYEVGDPIKDLDWFSSGGKLLPGVTQKYKRQDSMNYAVKPVIPHCLVVIDSSGSMPDPNRTNSPHAVSALLIARNYLTNGAMVGVLNFSNQSIAIPFGYDLKLIAQMLVGYQGGGTEIDVDVLMKMLKNDHRDILTRMDSADKDAMVEELKRFMPIPQEAMKKHLTLDTKALKVELKMESVDVYIITDGGLWNLGECFEAFDQISQKTRITVFHAPPSFELPVDQFPKNVALYRVEKINDLAKYTLGVLEQHFK